MKINSNTIVMENTDNSYKEIESYIKKLAEENNIDNVESVHISLKRDSGKILFKKSYESDEKLRSIQEESIRDEYYEKHPEELKKIEQEMSSSNNNVDNENKNETFESSFSDDDVVL
jgi:hypothetical protein